MITVRRLSLTGAALALAALVTTVWGDPGKDKAQPLGGKLDPPPAKVDKLADDLVRTKFSQSPVVTYQTEEGKRSGVNLFALQVMPKLEATAARPRDLAILVDTSASQFRGPIAAARELTETIARLGAGKNDRIAIWTVNVPGATANLTRGFVAPDSAAVRDAIKSLKQEVPFGAVDLKNALAKTVASFEGKDGRQQAIVFLGNGMSVVNPIENKDRAELCDKMVKREIAFFPIPLGPTEQLKRGSTNLHGFASGTGGTVVRVEKSEPADTVKKLNEALNAPVLYTRKLTLPADVTEFYPSKLPPVRSDAPTLVVGKIKAGNRLSYTVEGTVAGKKVKVQMTENLTPAEVENYFLVNLVEQWSKADKETPALIRADRALAMAFETVRLARDENVAQAEWAFVKQDWDGAAKGFKNALQIDPNDMDAAAGIRLVEKMRNAKDKDGNNLNREQMKQQMAKLLPNDDDLVTKIEKGQRPRTGKLKDMVAQAENGDKMAPDKVVQPDFNQPRDNDDLMRLQKQRMAVEEQRIGQIVGEVERQARQLLQSDPDAAHDLLRRTLQNVRDNPDLGNTAKGGLVTRLESALRNVDTQGARIKRDLEDRMRMLADAERRILTETQRAQGEEQVRRRVQAFGNLMDQGRYEEAYKEAFVMQQDQIAKGAPITPSMVATYDMSITATHIKEVNEVKRASQERYLLTMLQVDKSHIPFPDEPPVQFPPAATWRELTKLRKGVWDYTGLGEDEASRAAVNILKKKLDTKVTLDKGIGPNATLNDALEFLSDRYDFTIIVDSNAFGAVGVQKPEETSVQLPRMSGVSLATVLRLLLGQVKGDQYVGTYLIRRDYIEVTSTYHAALDKVVRAYPVADLVIPIPNSVNQQGLNQNLAALGQSQQAANPYGPQPVFPGMGFGGGFGGMPGMGMGGMGMGLPGGGGAFPGGLNPFQLQGGLPGNNQFGNLGGQFGLQGKDTSRQLMTLITQVVAPGEWGPLAPPDPAPGMGAPGGGLIPAAAEPPGLNDTPIVPRELLNQLGYYEPARALIVRGSTRVHTRVGGSPSGKPGAPPMGAANMNRDGALVFKPGEKRDKDPQVAAANDKRDKMPTKKAIEVDARTAWEEAIEQLIKDSGSPDKVVQAERLVIAWSETLVNYGKYDHAAEFLKACLRNGIANRPWMYEALSVALELSHGSPEEIERAQVSAIDLQPLDAQGYYRASKSMAELKRWGPALAMLKQASLMDPSRPDVYADALLYAEIAKDSECMSWAARNLMKKDWAYDNQQYHDRARARLDGLARALPKADADRLLSSVKDVGVRDLVITLTFDGKDEAELDLKVEEPVTGSVCSFMQRQTAGGGTLLGGELVNLREQSYIAGEAFSGKYIVTVSKIWGRPQGNRATLEIVRHGERFMEKIVFDGNKPAKVEVNLTGGRRMSIAKVTPTVARPERETADTSVGGDRILAKLRILADPGLADSGIRGSMGSTGFRSAAAETRTAPAISKTSATPERGTYQAAVQSYQSSAMEMMARTVIDPKTGAAGVKLDPVYTGAGRSASVTTPLIPGGN